MAFDGLAICAITHEFKEKLIGGRIDKIHQPERDEITMTVRCFKDSYKLILCANPTFARVHFTNLNKDNPSSPPMFCMLLRKHIQGGKIVDVCQDDFERIVKFKIESYDELGDLSVKTLIIEIMGKHSNIILTNQEGKIIDSIFHIDLTISSLRQVMPGLMYENPPSQGKTNILNLSLCEIKEKFILNEIPLSKQIMENFTGISPIIAREIVFIASGNENELPSENVIDLVSQKCFEFANNIKENNFKYIILFDDEKYRDFCAIDIFQYGNSLKKEYFETLNECADQFYLKKANRESIKQKTSDLTKIVSTNLDRCLRKKQLEEEILEKSKKREIYKIKGDLITANIYRIEKGASHIMAENFYNNNEIIEIALQTDLSPSKNAQKYYAKYNKAKTAEEETIKQKELNEKEIEYLSSVLEALSNVETSEDIMQIRDELTDEGYLKKRSKIKKKNSLPKPNLFVSSDGFEIYAGKNNKQNDYVTLKLARSFDIWFHTKDIHGSHVIIKTNGKDVPNSTLEEAAVIAAYYSKGKNSANVNVDYTFIKNVRKPSGAKPGMVIYDNNKTCVVTPNENIIEKLKKMP